MENRTYYYARVSSRDQNLDRQLAAFRALGAQEREIITDKKSGRDLDRPGYMALKNAMLRSGDTLVIKSLERLARRKADIKAELQYFHDHGIRVKVIDIPTTMIDVPAGQDWVLEMFNNILIEVLGTQAEQEWETTHKRQAEGIAVAKAAGKHLGRPQIQKPANWNQVYTAWRKGEISAKVAMDRTGLKRSSFYKLASREEGENNR